MLSRLSFQGFLLAYKGGFLQKKVKPQPLQNPNQILLRAVKTVRAVCCMSKEQPVPKKDHFLWLADLGTAGSAGKGQLNLTSEQGWACRLCQLSSVYTRFWLFSAGEAVISRKSGCFPSKRSEFTGLSVAFIPPATSGDFFSIAPDHVVVSSKQHSLRFLGAEGVASSGPFLQTLFFVDHLDPELTNILIVRKAWRCKNKSVQSFSVWETIAQTMYLAAVSWGCHLRWRASLTRMKRQRQVVDRKSLGLFDNNCCLTDWGFVQYP